MNENTNVDVLAVLRDTYRRAHFATREEWTAAEQAIAAVVELVEADKEYDVAKAEATPPHSCAEPSDEALKRLMIAEERRAAALARVQGGAQ